jgi:transcriptional regulator with XRE-family HTH domain
MKDRIEADRLSASQDGRPEERLSTVRAVLAGNLRAERIRRRLSRSEVAERTGMPPSHLAAIESGRCNASIEEMAKLAAILETPLWELLKP